jgi:hypothetical protein
VVRAFDAEFEAEGAVICWEGSFKDKRVSPSDSGSGAICPEALSTISDY